MALVHFGKDLRYLVPREVESRLYGANIYTKKASGFSKDAIESGIFFNLSKMEWVELPAVAQLILLIEEALRKEIRVEVALPLPKGRKSEIAFMQSHPEYASGVLQRINYRKAVLGFLTYLMFQEALRADHLGDMLSNLTIINDYDSSIARPAEHEENIHPQDERAKRGMEELKEPERLYKVCFPFCWISPSEQPDQMRNLARFITNVIRSSTDIHHGIEAVDADTIANVILYELVDNVFKHSRKEGDIPCALIAARVRPDTTPLFSDNYLDVIHPFIDWVSQKQTSVVEIVVGDSGHGIKKTLEGVFDYTEQLKKAKLKPVYDKTAEIMLWAFDRWSSCYEEQNSKRGTRGLYRVDRIVKKYEGLITLRSDNQLVGLDHGGPSYDEVIPPSDSKPKRLSSMPGTILNLWLPPFLEQTLPRKVRSEIRKDLVFEILDLGVINEEGIHPETTDQLRNLLNDENMLVLANVGGGAPNPAVIYETLRQSVELRHPGSLIISGLPGGENLIENAVESINDKHEKESRDKESHGTEHFEIWDPVLVVTPPGKSYWVGSSKTRRKVLDALVKEGGILTSEQFEELIADEKERTSTLLGLRNDTSVVTIRDDRSLELRFTLSSIAGHIQKILDKYVSEPNDGVKDDANYRSPSLHLLRKWLNVEKIIENSGVGSDLAMLALSERIKEHNCWEQWGAFDFIIYDSSSNSDNIDSLQRWLGIEAIHKEIMYAETGIPIFKGRPLVDPSALVVVYFDQLISSETADRCIKQILRDHAKPACVACIFDLRKDPLEDLEIWGVRLPVVSLSRIDIAIDSTQPGMSLTNINPITKQQEKYELTTDQDNRYRIKRKDFRKLIEKHKALHFSHIGRPIGRHFTFYIGSSKLIEDPEIYTAFNAEIDDWIDKFKNSSSTGSRGIEIWYPKSEPQPFTPAKRFSERINALRGDIKKIRPISRDPAYGRWSFPEGQTVTLYSRNILIIDWGALTGETVIQMMRLAAETGATNILICILISQLPQAEESFLYLVHSLQLPLRPSGQLSLLLTEEAEQAVDQLIENDVQVAVRFLSRFPIKAYQGENECPVCQRLSEFSNETYPTELLNNYAKLSNHEWLRARQRAEVMDTDTEDFLPGKAAVEMALFREELAASLSLTGMRQNVLEKIEKYYDAIQLNGSEPSEEILWLIMFLSVETLWFRTPPLCFKRCRELISKICLKVALNDKLEVGNRLSALIVLRVSSKSMFVNNLYDLFGSIISHESLLNQLLYSTFTYVNRPYHQTAEMFNPLLDHLYRIRLEYVERHLISNEACETIDVLIRRCRQECAKAGIRFYTPAQSWAKLRSIFSADNYRPHDSVPNSLRMMRPLHLYAKDIREKIDQHSTNAVPTSLDLNRPILLWLKQIKRYWNTCCDFLDNSILIHLSHLKPILQSEYARRVIGHEDVDRLVELIEDVMAHKIPLSESAFSKLVYSIAENPNLNISKENWNRYIANLEWFESRIFYPIQENLKPSRLIQFLMSAPCYLGQVFMDVYDGFKNQLPVGHKLVGLKELLQINPLVFCINDLVREIFHELLHNICKRLEGEDSPLTIWIDVNRVDNAIELIFRNNCTKVSGTGGGLDRLKDRLKLFGGDLKREPRPNDGLSTYRVDVIFRQGE